MYWPKVSKVFDPLKDRNKQKLLSLPNPIISHSTFKTSSPNPLTYQQTDKNAKTLTLASSLIPLGTRPGNNKLPGRLIVSTSPEKTWESNGTVQAKPGIWFRCFLLPLFLPLTLNSLLFKFSHFFSGLNFSFVDSPHRPRAKSLMTCKYCVIFFIPFSSFHHINFTQNHLDSLSQVPTFPLDFFLCWIMLDTAPFIKPLFFSQLG